MELEWKGGKATSNKPVLNRIATRVAKVNLNKIDWTNWFKNEGYGWE
jgi:hypothetical protein